MISKEYWNKYNVWCVYFRQFRNQMISEEYWKVEQGRVPYRVPINIGWFQRNIETPQATSPPWTGLGSMLISEEYWNPKHDFISTPTALQNGWFQRNIEISLGYLSQNHETSTVVISGESLGGVVSWGWCLWMHLTMLISMEYWSVETLTPLFSPTTILFMLISIEYWKTCFGSGAYTSTHLPSGDFNRILKVQRMYWTTAPCSMPRWFQ